MSVYTGMTMTWELVTPADAAKLLTHVPEYQEFRLNKVRHFQSISRDMTAGVFVNTHQPIAIDVDGGLMDGLQRCQACVMAHVPFETWVCRNCDPASYRFIDTGLKRAIDMPKELAAVSRSLLSYPLRFGTNWTYTEVKVAAVRHAAPIGIVAKEITKVGTRRVPCQSLAAFVRAYYNADEDSFARALFVMRHGHGGDVIQAGDMSLLTLRDYILSGTKLRAGGHDSRYAVYAKTERAIRAFLDRRDITKLLAGDMAELFPLPEEVSA